MKKSCFTALLCIVSIPLIYAQTCNNWLFNPVLNSSVSISNLNITGNAVTVEALINRTLPYLPGGGNDTEGDIVSKHNDFSDVNYLLRPNHAYITTTNGFFGTPDICDLKLNKTYHVALVYDGVTLKFYRNGSLMSQVNASGNLIQNNWKTRIGWYEPGGVTSQFLGYTNEVRIWNVARTQAQLKANMTGSLPNPTTQTGLQAYYTFDNLLNKQGNAAYNGTIVGSAVINQTNPQCNLTIDSCAVLNNNRASVIVNDYSPILTLNPCTNSLTVEDGTKYNAGDTVMIIQMKGAVIDSSNNSSFGTITNYKNAGNYEMNIVKSRTSNIVELKNTLLRQYDVPVGKVQLIRVPYFQDYVVTDTLTCLPWDGAKGGVLVLNVKNRLDLNGPVDVSEKGFRGGVMHNALINAFTCIGDEYYRPINTIYAAGKGESIADISDDKNAGCGKKANGGGGGMDPNTGGGGGSNASTGGNGGFGYGLCPQSNNWGLGGIGLTYNNTNNKIFMGGAGGAGHCNNGFDDLTLNTDFNGGNGGGIAIISAGVIAGTDNNINSAGAVPYELTAPGFLAHDGMGGGGAGGTVLINSSSFLSNVTVKVPGGRGGNMSSSPAGGLVGPGGGGGGGTVWLSDPGLPGQVSVLNNGGLNGVILQYNNDPYGATAGNAGANFFDLKIPVATTPFKPNIDSVRIKSSLTSCAAFDFKGFAYTNTNPIQSWQWSFGDNTGAATQNASHTYPAAGSYPVKLVVTDINGCKDSAVVTVDATSGPGTDFSYTQNSCNPLSVQFFNLGNTPVNPAWLFGDGGNSSGIADPVHAYASTGNYTVKYSVQNGTCIDTVVKVISINITPDDIILTKDTTICFGATKQLLTAPALSFCWSPVTSLDDPLSATPTTNTTVPITYYFTAEIPGNNLITNGSFSSGNSGFTSGYNFAAINTTEGEYFVGNAPQSWNGGLSTCSDHTGGNGNMLLVNGSPVPDIIVWRQTVTVTPNTNYAFATWIQALYPPNPAQLSFSINGKDVGTQITAALPTCTWDKFFTTWNSGSNTSATIAIVNKNTFVQGNDFALDDISFSPVIIKRDSVKISIDQPMLNAGNDTLVCEKSSTQMNASGANSYNWLPVTGLSNASISNPVATVTDTTQFIVTGTSAFGCTAADTVMIFTKPLPAVKTIADTAICRNSNLQLSSTGAAAYSWLPGATLNNAAVSNPVATPAATTTYVVTGTGSNGCVARDTVIITVNALPVVQTTADATICLGNTLPVTTTGAATYSWLPGAGVSNPASGNPNITPTDTTQYIVRGTNASGCVGFDTLNIFTRQLPLVKAGNDTIVCASTTVQLRGSGAQTYSWSPAASLNVASISNPIATPVDTTEYILRGTDGFGCSNSDSVIVFTRPSPIVTVRADTAICKNTPLQLSAAGGVSYQWSPAAGLNSPTLQNPTATTTTTTFYTVVVRAANNCTATDSVQITVIPDPVFTVSASDSTCFNTAVQLSAAGGSSYTWSPAASVSDANAATPFTRGNATTTYSVIIKENTCNFSDTLTTTVTVLPLPPVTAAKSNDVDCARLSAQLSATGAGSYSWSPAATLNSTTAANPVATPESTTLYQLTGTDASTGCTATDTITVFATKTGSANLFIPSAFSPNGDTRNDCFKVSYQGRFTEFSMSIFNRYGELVFFTRNADDCWDGTYKGKLQNTGNFVFIIKAKNLCSDQFKKGNLLLIR